MKLTTKLLIIFTLSLSIFGMLFFLTNYFKISVIEIEGEKGISLNGLSNLVGQNLIFTDISKAESNLLRQNAHIKSIKADKIYPNKLKIFITASTPIALFKVNSGHFALSDQGRIIAKKRSLDLSLPIITYYQQFDFMSFKVGDKIEYKDIIKALQILDSLINVGLTPDTIDIQDINMIASNIGEKKILFTAEKDWNQEQEVFETIIRNFKIKGQNFKLLDLRFEKPIVKF